MAVHERNYRPYEGPRTRERWRFLVIPRFVLSDVFRSRVFSAYYFLTFAPLLLGIVVLYLPHNLGAVQYLQLDENLVRIVSEHVFQTFLRVELGMGFLVALFVGPHIISTDMKDNALPLYLARPFSRVDYILGNFTVIASLLSLSTWVSGLLLFALQTYFLGLSWAWANLRVAAAIVFGSWAYIVFLSLLTLGCSAWAKTKLVARAQLLGVLLGFGAAGETIGKVFHSEWGLVLQLPILVDTVYAGLLGTETPTNLSPPTAACTIAVMTMIGLVVLTRRIRAYEVVR